MPAVLRRAFRRSVAAILALVASRSATVAASLRPSISPAAFLLVVSSCSFGDRRDGRRSACGGGGAGVAAFAFGTTSRRFERLCGVLAVEYDETRDGGTRARRRSAGGRRTVVGRSDDDDDAPPPRQSRTVEDHHRRHEDDDGSSSGLHRVPRTDRDGGDNGGWGRGANGRGRTPRVKEERTAVILYHKPPDVVTSHSSADAAPRSSSSGDAPAAGGGRRTVYEDVTSMGGYVAASSVPSAVGASFEEATGIRSKLHAVGRLDAATTGLLLLTNDGGLVHHVTNPTAAGSGSSVSGGEQRRRRHVLAKTYEAVIMGYHPLNRTHSSPALLELAANGADLGNKAGGGRCPPPLSLRVLDHPTSKSTRVEITLGEGRNRQVRRMFHAVGSGVMRLHRRWIGPWRDDDDDDDVGRGEGRGKGLELGEELKEGQWRLLEEEEVRRCLGWEFRPLVGGDDRAAARGGGRRGGGGGGGGVDIRGGRKSGRRGKRRSGGKRGESGGSRPRTRR